MIDTNTIKDRILSFAYQGKLVEPSQLSNDNIEAIHACTKGYIPVSEEEYLIDIPKEWKWTRLCYVTSNHGQVTPSDTFSYIDVGTLDNVNHRLSSSENIVEAKDAPSRAKKVVEAGDVIYSTVRPYLHNICIIDKDFSYTPIASTAFCVMHANEEVLDNKFLFYWLLTKEFDKYSNGDPSKGALYPAIGEKDLLKGVIPLPAVSEQKAIVAKIEAVFEILDEINVLQDQYVFNQEALKSKLIDAAIQGKLTEQLPEDGTAEELYKQIQSETQILIKEGRFKKKKALPDLSDVDYPFQIPKTWKWIHLGDLISIESGKGLTAAEMIPGDVPVYGGNGITGYHDNGFVPEGTIVIGRVGYYCGSVHVTQKESWVTDNAFITTYPENCVDKWFLVYVLRKMRLGQNNNGSAQPVVSGKKIYPLAFPLPPLAEQNRIADLFKTIIPMCESTK